MATIKSAVEPDWEAEYTNMKWQRDNTNSYHTRCHQEYKAQIKELTKERDALNIRNITLREVIDELEKERDKIKEERMHIMGLYNNAKSERDSLKHQLYTVTKETLEKHLPKKSEHTFLAFNFDFCGLTIKFSGFTFRREAR